MAWWQVGLLILIPAVSTFIIMWLAQDGGWMDRQAAKVARRIVRWLDEKDKEEV